MEALSLEITLALLAIAFIAGVIDAIAGGGGLITVPALLWSGIPPAQALGTNKLQACFGTLAAVHQYYKKGHINFRALRWAIFWTFLGAALGAVLVQAIDADFLYGLIPILLILVALYFLFSPNLGKTKADPRLSKNSFALIVGFSIGFYDGFFGPGTGSFFMAAFVLLAGASLIEATAQTKVLNLTSNLAALLFFTLGDNVLWTIGLMMAAAQILGGYAGAHLAINHGERLIRPLVVIISSAISIKLLISRYWPGS